LEANCGATPVGDNWDAWNADFFTPAAQLLTAAPWVFSRGNHEDCGRSWRGSSVAPRRRESSTWPSGSRDEGITSRGCRTERRRAPED
jgi:hypothetical protein